MGIEIDTAIDFRSNEQPPPAPAGAASSIDLPADGSVTASLPVAGKTLPLLVRRAGPASSLECWLRDHPALVTAWLTHYGAVMFRGFGVSSTQEFERTVAAVSSNHWVDYREAATPRSHVGGHVFTATDFHPAHRLYLHNENSHVTTWPLRLYFCCLTPPESGGETAIADSRRIFSRIDPGIRQAFIDNGWLYVRTFGYGLGLPWTKVFETDSKSALAEYCAKNYMHHEWRPDGGLVVRYRRWAALKHPDTLEETWFNHGIFYNFRTLAPALQDHFLRVFGEHKMPYNTFCGDGTKVSAETIAVFHAAYDAETVRLPWQRGDVMIVDNMLVAHGREPFKGKRDVFVAMSHTIACESIARPSDYLLAELHS